MIEELVKLKNEERIYMGPKYARIPRGSRVKLVAVIRGKWGIFEWNGERFCCPVRLLWRIKEADSYGKEKEEDQTQKEDKNNH